MSARDKPKDDCMLCHGIGMYEQACESCYPSAQPHVAAGSGFKERLWPKIHNYATCCEVGNIAKTQAAGEAIDRTLAEVCELPEPAKDAIEYGKWLNGKTMYIIEESQLVHSQLLPLAAALIRAATAGRDAS